MTQKQNDTQNEEQEKIIMERTFMGERKNEIRERKPGKKEKNRIRKCAGKSNGIREKKIQ